MKSVIFLACLIPLFAFAQKEKLDEFNPDQLTIKEFKLEAQELAPSEIKLPFKNIKILDSRFDTSKIGYVPNADNLAGKKNAFRKMTLRGGNSIAIQNYYNDFYAESFTPSDYELLIVMKRFWFSGNKTGNDKRIEVANSFRGNNSIQCKWEYYIGKNGNYLRVKKIDTTFISTENHKNLLNNGLSLKSLFYIKSILNALVEMLDFSNAIVQFDKQPKKTFTEIQEYNNRMNNIPVLKDSGFTKGIYLSFEDFKNKRPSIIEFKEKEMRYGRLNRNTKIYLEDIKGETISNYWGYSDGKDFRYGMLGNDKIYRIQNTFCFFIKVLEYSIHQDNRGQFGGSSINTISKDKYETWVPFQIDMETGEIY